MISDSLVMREGSLSSFSSGMSLSGFRNSLSLKYPDGILGNIWMKNILWGLNPGQKFPWIWGVISDGCGETELDIAFNRTAGMIYNAASVLTNFNLKYS